MQRNFSKTAKLSYRLPFGEKHYTQFLDSHKTQIAHEFQASQEDDPLYNSVQIEPFLDIIEGHDLELKINAIGKLSTIKTRESISLLKVALDDENYEVRYFASNSLSLMEKSLIADIEAYNQNITRFMSDHQNYTLRGLSYLNMFYLGIIDQSIGGVFLEQALNNFLYSLQLNPDQHYLYVKIVEIYTYQREHTKILELIPPILEKNLAAEDLVKVLFYQAEAHFNLRKFSSLKSDCEIISKAQVKIPLMVEPLDFWGRF